MRRKPRAREPMQASTSIASVRRTVWRRRITVVLAVVLGVSSYCIYLDRRVAHLRVPEAVRQPDSQVFRDALEFLRSPEAQLTLQATITDFGRYGCPGPMSPQNPRLSSTGRLWISVSSFGTIGETGAPVIYPGGEYTITAHVLDLFGLVRKVTVECRYVVCWDRAAREGRILAAGESLPDLNTTETVGGNLARYSEPYVVTDVLTMGLSGKTQRWQARLVARVQAAAHDPGT